MKKLFLTASALALFGPSAGENFRLRNLNGVIGVKPSTRPAAVRPGDSKDIAFGFISKLKGTGEVKTIRSTEAQYVDFSGIHMLDKGKLHWHDVFIPTAEKGLTDNTVCILIAESGEMAELMLQERNEASPLPALLLQQLTDVISAERVRETEAATAAAQKLAAEQAAQQEAQQQQASTTTPTAAAPATGEQTGEQTGEPAAAATPPAPVRSGRRNRNAA